MCSPASESFELNPFTGMKTDLSLQYQYFLLNVFTSKSILM